MNKGEKKNYDNSLKNLINTLHQTYEENQKIIKTRIEGLDSHLGRIESNINGLKTRIKNETDYLRGTIREAIAARSSLKEIIEDIDPDIIEKIKKITQIITYGKEY